MLALHLRTVRAAQTHHGSRQVRLAAALVAVGLDMLNLLRNRGFGRRGDGRVSSQSRLRAGLCVDGARPIRLPVNHRAGQPQDVEPPAEPLNRDGGHAAPSGAQSPAATTARVRTAASSIASRASAGMT